MRPHPLLIPLLTLSLLTSPSLAQQKRSIKRPPPSPTAITTSPDGKPVRDISGILDPIIREHKIPAMSAAIVKGWDTVALGVAGVRKSGDTTRATIQDKWHIGSDTKAMTATLCGVLVEENQLRWDLTLAEAFPDLAPKMSDAWKPVTLEQLLTHRAGAPDKLEAGGLWQSLWTFKGSPTEARRALLEGVLKHPPESTPGTAYLYSNAGFAIAGHIAETITKTPYEKLITEKVFDPLQMFSIGFGAPGSPEVKAPKPHDADAPPGGYKIQVTIDQPRGHRASGSPVEPGPNADNPIAIAPAGTLHCSIPDWAKFIALHLRSDPANPSGGEHKLLRVDTIKKLHTPAQGGAGDPKYAMGWGVTSRPWAGPNANVLTHAGSNTMWYAITWIAPEKDFAILIACNQGGDAAVKACDQAAMLLISEAVQNHK